MGQPNPRNNLTISYGWMRFENGTTRYELLLTFIVIANKNILAKTLEVRVT